MNDCSQLQTTAPSELSYKIIIKQAQLVQFFGTEQTYNLRQMRRGETRAAHGSLFFYLFTLILPPQT